MSNYEIGRKESCCKMRHRPLVLGIVLMDWQGIMMKIFSRLFVFLSALFVISFVNAGENKKIIWTAVFSNAIPLQSDVTQDYCNQHTPTVMVTTIDQITSKDGVRALNGIVVRYLSYKEIEKDHLNFNIVDATISGKDSNGKAWSSPMKLYEQTLNSVDVTYTVWSTPYCKGTFLGTPTVIVKIDEKK